jgi:hypothetical protein
MTPAERAERIRRSGPPVKYGATEEGGDDFYCDDNEVPDVRSREEMDAVLRFQRAETARTGKSCSWDTAKRAVLSGGPERYGRRQPAPAARQAAADDSFDQDDIGRAMGVGPERYRRQDVASGGTARLRQAEERVSAIRKQLDGRNVGDSERRSLIAELSALSRNLGGDKAHLGDTSTPDWNKSSFNPPAPSNTQTIFERLNLPLELSGLPPTEPWLRRIVMHKGKAVVFPPHEERQLEAYVRMGNSVDQTVDALGLHPQDMNDWRRSQGTGQGDDIPPEDQDDVGPLPGTAGDEPPPEWQRRRQTSQGGYPGTGGQPLGGAGARGQQRPPQRMSEPEYEVGPFGEPTMGGLPGRGLPPEEGGPGGPYPTRRR